MWRKGNLHALLVEMHIGAGPMESIWDKNLEKFISIDASLIFKLHLDSENTSEASYNTICLSTEFGTNSDVLIWDKSDLFWASDFHSVLFAK